ncbi:MAG: hypothetical protein WBZ48_10805 [Bacteroidota bacterium]
MTLQVYKFISLSLSLIFSLVGLAFLFLSADILKFFNTTSALVGMQEGAVEGTSIYVVLAVAYMYLVALLTYLMYRDPDNHEYPFLLMNGKLMSGVVSLGLFLAVQPLLIYLANGVIDGSIGLLAMTMYRSAKKGRP